MRLSLTFPVPAGPTTRYTPAAARSLVSKPTTLTLPDGARVLAIIVFASVEDDGRTLVVTVDFDPPKPGARGARSRSQSQPTSGNTAGVTSQVTPRSQRRSQPSSQPAPAIFRSAEAT